MSCFTVTEQKKIERAVLADKRQKMFGIVLCLYTGLRIGELLALTWKDIDFINQIFSDDALIITGKVVTVRNEGDFGGFSQKVEYTKQSKEQYILNLRRAFARNKWIDVKFSEIGDNGEVGGCAGITRSRVNCTMYGVRLRQEWRSSSYSDEGYLFLLWEFPEDGRDPIIHVRTWQPEWVGGVQQQPDDDISTLGAFDL